MRFLHTADWHVGKTLNGFSLLDDQAAVFKEIEAVAKKEQVDAVVVAGDLYDRSVPSEAAIRQLNQMLVRLNLSDRLPLLAISGNHDSATRLGRGAAWFSYRHLYLNTSLADAFTPVTIADTQFFLLPFFGIQEVRNYFADDKIRDVNTAMQRIVAAMQGKFDPHKHHVLVAHFFAAGSRHTAESETLVEVGGLSAVETGTLAPFDYVALGHLHNRNALQADRVKYSGSPMKFSVSEADQEKGVWIVDTAPFAVKWVPLAPIHDIHRLKGRFADLLQEHGQYPRDDFYDIELTNRERIPDVMNKLRECYPRIVSLHRTHRTHNIQAGGSRQMRHRDPMDILAAFFEQTTGTPLSAGQRRLAAQVLEEIGKEGK